MAVALRARLNAFEELLRLSGPRVAPGVLTEARDLLVRADERRRLSMDHTVIALAGTTGSGKSSLFNAVCGRDLSAVGVRRPTTGAAVACVWDAHDLRDGQGAGALLDRLAVPLRRRYVVGGRAAPGGEPRGVVLVDLPDHDSVDAGHRAEVDRLIRLADVLVWVLDPEKYADASVHERYLRPLARHADVMFVVLNQIDRLPQEAIPQCMNDLRRLLDEDGLALGEYGEDGTQVLAVSALTGEGIGDLRAALGEVVRERGSAGRRLGADLDRAAHSLHGVFMGDGPIGLPGQARDRFLTRLGDLAGAAEAGQAAEEAYLRETVRACASPLADLVRRRGKPDPGRKGGAGRTGGASGPQGAARVAVPWPVVGEAVRDLAYEASAGLPRPWAEGVRQAAEHEVRLLARELERVVVTRAPSGCAALPGWVVVVRVLHWALLVVALTGGAALAAGATWAWAWPWQVSAGLLVGGLVAGPVLGRLFRYPARGPARRHGQDVERLLREAAEERGRARVLLPVEAELRRYRAVRERFAEAAGH